MKKTLNPYHSQVAVAEDARRAASSILTKALLLINMGSCGLKPPLPRPNPPATKGFGGSENDQKRQ